MSALKTAMEAILNEADLDALEALVSRRPSIDPLISATEALLQLQSPTARKKLDREQVERDLRKQEDNLAYDNLSQLESMLGAQAHVLHGIFTHATERYAKAQAPEQAKLYIGIALKAQTYCRLTVSALARIKKYNENNAPKRQIAKMRNELSRQSMANPGAAWTPPSPQKPYVPPAPNPPEKGKTPFLMDRGKIEECSMAG